MTPTAPVALTSDSGVDATAIDGGDHKDATTTDAPVRADDGDAAPSPHDAGDAADGAILDAAGADVDDAADASDGGFAHASLLLAPASSVIGVASDDYVIEWTAPDAGACARGDCSLGGNTTDPHDDGDRRTREQLCDRSGSDRRLAGYDRFR